MGVQGIRRRAGPGGWGEGTWFGGQGRFFSADNDMSWRRLPLGFRPLWPSGGPDWKTGGREEGETEVVPRLTPPCAPSSCQVCLSVVWSLRDGLYSLNLAAWPSAPAALHSLPGTMARVSSYGEAASPHNISAARCHFPLAVSPLPSFPNSGGCFPHPSSALPLLPLRGRSYLLADP